jgi:hypothetical protein
MDLRSIANNVSRTINDNRVVTILKSTGYTIGAGRKQTPTYASPIVVPAQIQALDSKDLKQLDGLNIQGTIKAIYLRGTFSAVIRPEGVGGDIVQFDNQNWLVVKILEGWSSWTKAAIVLQGA